MAAALPVELPRNLRAEDDQECEQDRNDHVAAVGAAAGCTSTAKTITRNKKTSSNIGEPEYVRRTSDSVTLQNNNAWLPEALRIA